MRTLAALLLLVLCSCGTTRVSANLGQAEMDEDMKPANTPTLAGIEVSDVPDDGGLGWEAGGHWGRDTTTTAGDSLTTELWEGYAGPRYEFRHGNFAPYLSGGASVVTVHGAFPDKGSTETSRDTDLGLYLGAGVDWDIAHFWMIGLGVRKTFDQELTLAGVTGNADAWQFLFRFGVSY